MKIDLNKDVVYFMDEETLVITDLNADAKAYRVSGSLAKFSYELFQGNSTFTKLSKKFKEDEVKQLKSFLKDLESLSILRLSESAD
ncbi:MAG: hypothetical protein CME64_01060 [Halobacteriovoraceae bacterium]|nr:hypothetical protein [Halobacteriovoraceae bacterium]|tara:strand:- start:228934 stop:229191 length:258 start_codon:yes stop_codon:yes gene_type:complete